MRRNRRRIERRRPEKRANDYAENAEGTDSSVEDIDLDEMRSAYEGEDATPIGEVREIEAADVVELLAHHMVRRN
jgi:hypothetical protein